MLPPTANLMSVYWLQQREADVPPQNDWLSASEVARLSGMRFAKRRDDWRLGRWTAKSATAVYLNLGYDPETLAQIEIPSDLSGAPCVFYLNQATPVAVSISHRSNTALCAIASIETDLGCDLEMMEPHSDAFIADYFTAEEQSLVARASAALRPLLVTLVWSAKESALKAMRVGLRVDTRSVVVKFLDDFFDETLTFSGHQPRYKEDPASPLPLGLTRWRPLQARNAQGQIFHGWWQQAGNLVQTLVASPVPAAPVFLKHPSWRCQLEMGTIR